MTDLLHRSIGAGITIETRFEPALSDVCADAGQLELAILNLAVNARDAMADGGLIAISGEGIRVTDDQGPLPAGAYVRLSVSDTGEGMDEETLARAMEPFFTTKGIGKGTGLGLSMVHGLADQCGGRLTLESERTHGTTAALWLPTAEHGLSPGEKPSSAPNRTEPPLEPMLILAVDDDQLVLMNTVAMLEDLGHRVIQAGSGADALQILRANRIDMMVADYAMPGMTGQRLAEEVRATWPETDVLLVSGYADIDRKTTFDFPNLSKPFNRSALARALARART
jgi:CheY-like chemotaxis protein